MLTCGSSTLTSPNAPDLFIGRLTPAGAWQWVRQIGGRDVEKAGAIAVDAVGDIVVIGAFDSDTLSFGTTTLSAAVRDVFVAKLNAAGTWQWAVRAGGSIPDEGYDVAIDGSGQIYVSGMYISSSATFGNTVLTTGRAVSNGFVAKLSTAGAWQWALATGTGGPSSSASGYGIATNRNGVVLVTGNFLGTSRTFGATTLVNASGYSGIFLAQLATLNNLPEESHDTAFTLAPNPAHHSVLLTGATSATAEVVDALGRTVRTLPLEPGTANLSLQGLPPGLYVVRCGGATRRLVVE